MILLFTFGALPAIAMPLVVAATSILNTFTLVWLLTYVTDVSIGVQFLIALVGLGVAIDYALLMIFRFREELRHGADRESALVETMRHAGRSVIVSGSTVAVGLLSLIVLPLPFLRSIGIGGMLIPADLRAIERRVEETAGVAGAAAPESSRTSRPALVEALSSADGSAKETRRTIERLKEETLPALRDGLGAGTRVTLAGYPPEDREFVRAMYGTFPYVLLFVVVITYLLLMRAFRSVLLPLKAVLLNLVSLGAAFGIIVFIFQKGHGAEEI